MATPSDKLAASLAFLKALQDQGRVAIRASDMTRTHRERLLKNGFIREVMKGWYIPARPDEPPGESTAWYASFWDFCTAYLNERFGSEWCLSPEQSVSLHTGHWTTWRCDLNVAIRIDDPSAAAVPDCANDVTGVAN